MVIVFLGTGAFGVPALSALHENGHEVALAVSQPDRPAGRGRRVAPTPIHAAADELGIPHLQTADVNREPLDRLVDQAALGVVVAFGQKISGTMLDRFPRGCVNIHASLLPKYRGAAPINWAMINDEPTTGVTVFQLNERWDAGDVWGFRETPIDPHETASELHDRLAQLGAALVVESLAMIAQDRQPTPQDATQATRAPKLSKATGYLDWAESARALQRRIHGLWSWPAATTEFVSRSGKVEPLLLARATVVDPDCIPTANTPPGAFRTDGTVQTGRGTLRLLEVKPASGKVMAFEAFANGRQVAPGDHLRTPSTP